MSATEVTHSGPILDQANGFEIVECIRCGFTHALPLPSPEELATVYRDQFYNTTKPLYMTEQHEDLEWWNLVYQERYQLFEQHLPAASRRILDVGSGPGFFLMQGKQRGWTTMGIEPSVDAVEYSRRLGLEVVGEFLTESTARQLGSFDVVHMSEVLEHIPDPGALLGLAHSITQPGGLLCVVVPNDYSPFQKAMRSVGGVSPWWLSPPIHLNYFNFDSLARLVRSQGFEVVHTETTFPIDLFLLMGDNYVGNGELGRACHKKRMTFEKNLAQAGMAHVKRHLYEALAHAGIGREVVMVCRRAGSSPS